MIKRIEQSNRLLILLIFPFLTIAYSDARGQQPTPMVRLAKIVVDSSRLAEYKVALKEEAEKSVQIEPGVLTLYAVSEKANPTHFTILEIYADSAAYLAHLQTPHFIKYKTITKDMVKSLELVEADPLIPEMLIKSSITTRKRK
jgi:quinol monooxygenase YgiN